MSDTQKTAADRQSEVLDVQLMDAFAQIEALLRLGREVQREALKVRGVPHAVSPPQRQAAGQMIREHLGEMKTECRTLGSVISELHKAATRLDKLLRVEVASS